jgi:hypothetical protein
VPIYSNQVVTGVNPKNPKILGCDRAGTHHVVGVLQRGSVAVVRMSKNEFKLCSELIPVWKMGRGKRTNVRSFYLSWNEDFVANVWRRGT